MYRSKKYKVRKYLKISIDVNTFIYLFQKFIFVKFYIRYKTSN